MTVYELLIAMRNDIDNIELRVVDSSFEVTTFKRLWTDIIFRETSLDRKLGNLEIDKFILEENTLFVRCHVA